MGRQSAHPQTSAGDYALRESGLGAARLDTPEWITPELIALTLSTWQPHYAKALTEQDAIEMLLHVGAVFDVLVEK